MLVSRHQLWDVTCPAQLMLPPRHLPCRFRFHCGAGANVLPSQSQCSASLQRRNPLVQQQPASQPPRIFRIPSASALCAEPAAVDEPQRHDLHNAELPGAASNLEAQLSELSLQMEELEALKCPGQQPLVRACTARAWLCPTPLRPGQHAHLTSRYERKYSVSGLLHVPSGACCLRGKAQRARACMRT